MFLKINLKEFYDRLIDDIVQVVLFPLFRMIKLYCFPSELENSNKQTTLT